MNFTIRIMYGEDPGWTKRFGFYSDAETATEDFDKAVKSINQIYHAQGRFRTKQEVVSHFKQYGFTQYAL